MSFWIVGLRFWKPVYFKNKKKKVFTYLKLNAYTTDVNKNLG